MSALIRALHVVRPNEGLLGSAASSPAVNNRRRYFAHESETAEAEPEAALDLHAHDAYDQSRYVVTREREIVVDEHAGRPAAAGSWPPARTRADAFALAEWSALPNKRTYTLSSVD